MRNSESIKSQNEISFLELLALFKVWINFVKSKFVSLLLVAIIAGLSGFLYAYLQKISYESKITFVVEESKSGSSGLGGLASLAGQFGVDVGGNGGGGLLSGDNILLYFKSPSLAREVALSKFDSLSEKTVADVYSDVHGFKKKWEKKGISNISFHTKSKSNGDARLKDSLLNLVIEDILNYRFSVYKTDKKASFIDVLSLMEEETLSKIYCERIVQKAVDRYVSVKTQRQKATVDQLQLRVDSIAKLLNKKTVSGASLQTNSSTMDINPLYKTNSVVAVETTIRDKSMLTAIFTSVTQNLELAKFNLSQETPVIQIIDSPVLPLKQIKVSRTKTALIYSIIAVFIAIIFFTIKWVSLKSDIKVQ